MKRLGAILAAAFLLILTACSNPKQPEVRLTNPTQPSAEKVQQKAKETVETAGDYAASKKQDYQSKIQSQLREFENRIDNLKAKSGDANEAVQAKINEQIQALQSKQNEIANQLNDLKRSGGNAWDELTNGIDTAMKDLQRSYEQALDELNQAAS